MKKAWTWKDVKLSKDLLEKLSHAFEVDLYRSALEHDPYNVDLLVFLGDFYSKRGAIIDSLEIDKRLVQACPQEPTFYYNLACSHSLLNQVEPALEALERAIRLGYDKLEFMEKDSDLDNLRKDSRFHQILRDLSNSKR